MKYAKKIPQADPELREALLAEGWKQIKEAPNLITAILLSVPFMLINALICYLLLFLAGPHYTDMVNQFIFSGAWTFTIRFDYILYIYLFVLVHEVLHLMFIPKFYKSEKTYFGIRPWGGFVFTTEKLSKGRFLLITIAPFAIITILITALLGLSDFAGSFVIFLLFLNALASSVDMLNAFIIAIQVPNGSVIIGNGFETYFKDQAN